MEQFVLKDDFVQNYETVQPDWGFPSGPNSIGEITFFRTYSRKKENGTKERWHETVRRVVEGIYSYQKNHCLNNDLNWSESKAERSAEIMFDKIFNFKFTPPGRGLWMAGTEYVEERGGAALNNCGFVSTDNKERPAESFAWLMDMSMLGVGVGFDTDGVGMPVYQPIYLNGNSPSPVVIPDSREGWVDSVRILLESYFHPGLPIVEFDYSLIRPKGAPIRGFGGVAEGPEPLIKLHDRIRTVLNNKAALDSRAIVDIMNMIGACVVAGNVRRSAEIALGNANDKEFLNLKNYEENPDRAMWAWASNNSVKGEVGKVDYDDIASRIADNGEPGLVYMDVARTQGRIGEFKDDPNAKGFNPCGEQVLDDRELCTLVEVFPSRHDSYEEFQETLKFAYLYAKSVTLVPTHDDSTNRVMKRNRRIGTSLSGQVDFRFERGIERLKNWMLDGYDYLESLDDQYSAWLNINKSIRKTTVKPSGTTSLLAGVSPGAHYPTHDTYIRRVRFSENHELVEKLRNANYPVEQDLYSDGTVVVEMPVKGRGLPTEKDVSIWEKASMATFASYYWADNSVSVTVTFDETEKDEIADVLRFNEGKWKSVSMLPLTKDGAYKQMPYEAITEEEYQRRAEVLTSIDLDEFYSNGEDAEGEIYCTTDKCMIV